MPDLPGWLTDALTGHSASVGAIPQPAELVDHTPSRGEIAPVSMGQPEQPVRLALVLRCDPATQSARVALLSPEVDLITDTDILLTGEELGLRFDLLLQTELLGAVFYCQLGLPIANLADSEFEALSNATRTPELLAGRRGLPIRDERDLRWAHKQAEAEMLEQLVRRCQGELLDRSAADVDPDALHEAVQAGDDAACRCLFGDAEGALNPYPPDLLPDPPAPDVLDEDVDKLVLDFFETSWASASPRDQVGAALDEAPIHWNREGGSARLSDLVRIRAREGYACVWLRSLIGFAHEPPTAAQTAEGLVQINRDERTPV